MRAFILALCLFPVLSAHAQRAPGAPTPDAVQAQIARLQIDIAKNDEARRRIDAELRDLERRASELHLQQQLLQNESVRLQSELLLLRQQAR
ncbi:MAG: hypothetical protein ACM3PU_11220 [Gemmatimonadota bacterium]